MINLITGGPGTGKTAFTVSQLIEEKYQGRPLYVDGVTDLAIEHQTFDPEKWPEELPDGALAVVDECQRYWRPAGPGKAPPLAITELETHRHRGIDFFFITQHPSLVHQNIRRLVARHIHIIANWSGRKQYEWAECKTDPSTGRQTAVSKPYKLPKKVYSLYKSAEIHTKQERRIPAAVYVFVIAVIVAGGLAFKTLGSVSDKMGGEQIAQVQPGGTQSAAISSIKSNQPDSFDFTPRVPYLPESAPAYDKVRKISSFPQMKACITSESKGCTCYTQQGTIYRTTNTKCLLYIAQGEFDPYVQSDDDNRKKQRTIDKDSTGSESGRAAGPSRSGTVITRRPNDNQLI